MGVLLFLGPTGVGKTESAKALTELLFDDAARMIRIDMNEITTPLAAEQLVGTFDAPDGRLTSAIRRQPHAVVLLDEIEKAHPDVFDYLLQVLGEGRMTDARGRVVDFRNSIIILTSNLGSGQSSNLLGFENQVQAEGVFRRAAERFFRPEFFNRIDEVIAFSPLTETDIKRIALIQLRHLLEREGMKRRNVFVRIETSALEHIARVGFDKHLGARAVRRALEQEIVQPLADQLAETLIQTPVLIRVSHSTSGLTCQSLSLLELAPPPLAAAPSLESLVAAAKPRVQEFEQSLASVHTRLQAADSPETIRANQLEYYTLHEQVFRCNQLLRSAQHRLTIQSQPNLNPVQRNPAAAPRITAEGTASRRMLREWLADEDLRDTLSVDEREQTDIAEPLDAIASQLRRELSMTQVMLASVGGAKRWLFGIETLSRPAEESSPSSESTKLFTYLLEPEIYFWDCLLECLEQQWQYEVETLDGLENYRLVSGVALAGLLRSIAGIYTIESNFKGRDLCVLRALPLPDDLPTTELPRWIQEQSILNATGLTPAPTGQPYGHNVIRGEIAAEVVDYASGSRLRLRRDRNDDAIHAQQWAQWWIDTLRVE